MNNEYELLCSDLATILQRRGVDVQRTDKGVSLRYEGHAGCSMDDTPKSRAMAMYMFMLLMANKMLAV